MYTKPIYLLSLITLESHVVKTECIGLFSSIDKAKDYCDNAYYDENFSWYEASSTLCRGESQNMLVTITFYLLDEFCYD